MLSHCSEPGEYLQLKVPIPHLGGRADDCRQRGLEEPVRTPGRRPCMLCGRGAQADGSGGLRRVAVGRIRRADGVRMLFPELLLVLVNVCEGWGTLQPGSQQEGLGGLGLGHWGT